MRYSLLWYVMLCYVMLCSVDGQLLTYVLGKTIAAVCQVQAAQHRLVGLKDEALTALFKDPVRTAL
jgi:hypothetical protein